MVPPSLRQMSAEALIGPLRAAWIEEAIQFVRLCVLSTPLREHARRFDTRAPDERRTLERAVVEALDGFGTDLARWNLHLKLPSDLRPRLQLAPNLLATFFYRLGSALHANRVGFLPEVVGVASRMLTGMEAYYSAAIGNGLKVIHGAGTVIGAGCRIGNRFTVFQGVTIGDKLGARTGGRPVIGDDVIASAGAKVLGPVTVGSGTIIGANAVVISSLPARCMAAGIPARVKAANLSDRQLGEFAHSLKETGDGS